MADRPMWRATPLFRLLLVATVSLATACGGEDSGTPDPISPTVTAPSLSTPTPTFTPPSDRVAFAVGDQLVSRSDDQGASWRDVFNIGTGGVWGVDFVDRTTGWVVGGRAIYRTTTGGRVGEWENQTSNVEGGPVDLYDVAFVDAAQGVAVGRGEDMGAGAVALVTSDGGLHWRRRTVGRPQTWLTRLCLSPDGTGAAVGEGVFREAATLVLTTDDGGESWTEATAAVREAAGEPIILANCEHLPPSLFWVVGAPSFLAESADGGATWTTQSVTDRSDVLLNAVRFVDRETGWVSGYDAETQELLIFRTDDAGATWDEQVLVDGVTTLEQQPSAAFATLGPEVILFVGDDPNSFALEGARALSFVSRDAGASWTASVIPGGYTAFRDVDAVP